jgi:hypothetical protein
MKFSLQLVKRWPNLGPERWCSEHACSREEGSQV